LLRGKKRKKNKPRSFGVDSISAGEKRRKRAQSFAEKRLGTILESFNGQVFDEKWKGRRPWEETRVRCNKEVQWGITT